jgi:hypothetical protein
VAVVMAIGLLLDRFGVVPFVYFMLLVPIVGLVSIPVCVGIGCIYRAFLPIADSHDTVYSRLGPMLTFLASVAIGC